MGGGSRGGIQGAKIKKKGGPQGWGPQGGGQTDIFINYSIPTECFANQGLNGKDGPITFGTSTTPVRITPMSSHW